MILDRDYSTLLKTFLDGIELEVLDDAVQITDFNSGAVFLFTKFRLVHEGGKPESPALKYMNRTYLLSKLDKRIWFNNIFIQAHVPDHRESG
jgi:hypothetical protein